jgi:hypothetical protein
MCDEISAANWSAGTPTPPTGRSFEAFRDLCDEPLIGVLD